MGANEPGDNEFSTTAKEIVALSFVISSCRKDLLNPITFDEKVGAFQNLPLGVHSDNRGVLK